jgi:hypothetical protein
MDFIGMDFIGAAGLIVSCVGLVLSRIDRSSDRHPEKLDLEQALIEMHELLREWARRARGTNAAIELWLEHGMPTKLDEDVTAHIGPQTAISEETLELLGGATRDAYEDSKPADSSSLRAVLAVYGPELLDVLLETAQTRRQQLEETIARFRSAAGDEDVLSELQSQLAESADRLSHAATYVRVYLTEHFEPGTGS